jgi:hypothetical protein
MRRCVSFIVCVIVILSCTIVVGTALAASGKCLLIVDGHKYIDGDCEIVLQGRGDFQISTPKKVKIMRFALVQKDESDGTVKGYWNGKTADSHAGDPLGELTAQGAFCWSNNHAAVCAKISEATAVQSDPIDKMNCGQFIIMHGMVSTAQLQCQFSSYSAKWMERARICSAQLGEQATDAGLKTGVNEFFNNIKEHGKSAECSEILDAFPDAVRR